MLIRTEIREDIPTIRKLIYAAFKNHPHHEPGAEPTEHEIVDKLRERGELVLSLVAEMNGEVVGHIAYSPVMIHGEDLSWLGLAPVSVAPEKQCQGIGSQLISESLELLKGKDVDGFALLGDPVYYGRFGFKNDSRLILPGVPAEYFQVLPCGENIPEGEVRFSPAFG